MLRNCLKSTSYQQNGMLALRANIVYKKPGLRPSRKSLLAFGHIVVLKVSQKCPKSMKKVAVIAKTKRQCVL